MTIVYIIAASVIVYGMLIGFRQIQSLKERIDVLERDKHETEALLLSFMESMNDVVKSDNPKMDEEQPVEEVLTEVDTNESVSEPDVEEVLLRHSVRETARLLGKGEGEVALYAKLRKK